MGKRGGSKGPRQTTGAQLSNAAQVHYDRCSDAYTAFVAAVAACAFAQFIAEFEPLAKLYADYKRQAALLDFDDLLYHARDLLAGNEHVRQALAQRYPRILVDEFQDTDPLQAEILWHLCGEGVKGAPWTERKLRAGSLFVVGDPKQAIYRFRGADVDTYLDAKRAILAQDPNAALEIVANFRSLKEIIDFANDQFRGLLSPENGQPGFTALQPTRLPRDERPAVACFDVTIGDDHKTDKGKIVVDRVWREEARIVADLVSGLIGTYQVWDKRSKSMRPCRAGDIALLAPTGTNLWIYERALEQREISIASQALAASVRRALGIPEVAALRDRLMLQTSNGAMIETSENQLSGLKRESRNRADADAVAFGKVAGFLALGKALPRLLDLVRREFRFTPHPDAFGARNLSAFARAFDYPQAFVLGHG
jgi:ATP-dependent exoDNAse (exonuclease V) beta subunit